MSILLDSIKHNQNINFNIYDTIKEFVHTLFRHLEKQQKWHIALGDEGKVIAVLTDNILEIRTKRSEYATIAARTTGNYVTSYC